MWTEKDYDNDFQMAAKANSPPGKSFARALYNLERIATSLEAFVAMHLQEHQANKDGPVMTAFTPEGEEVQVSGMPHIKAKQ